MIVVVCLVLLFIVECARLCVYWLCTLVQIKLYLHAAIYYVYGRVTVKLTHLQISEKMQQKKGLKIKIHENKSFVFYISHLWSFFAFCSSGFFSYFLCNIKHAYFDLLLLNNKTL